MVAFEVLQTQNTDAPKHSTLYEVTEPLNLYDSPTLQSLATQVSADRKLRFILADVTTPKAAIAYPVVLWEDDYPGWMAPSDLVKLQPATAVAPMPPLTAAEIQACIPQVLSFAQAALSRPNTYLWGGTLGPDYDCSGLVQHAFSAHRIWLPRDAYQQEAFVQPLSQRGDRPEAWLSALIPGDLLFFGTPIKATHVALYLGNGTYLHSSGQEQGRNGIGLDSLTDLSEPVSRTYYAQVRGAGRVVQSYQPQRLDSTTWRLDSAVDLY